MKWCYMRKVTASIKQARHFKLSPKTGQILETCMEEENAEARHVVAVLLNEDTVGHMSHEISRTSWFFLRRGDRISCEIIGRRRRSA